MQRLFLSLLVVLGFSMVCASPAMAQATRTWVSGVGDDANPCSRTAPCKTFAGAISKTTTAGEIDVLDPGGFGTLTVAKSITVDGSGGSIAGVLASGVPGFTINAPGGTVILKNLDIDGVAGGSAVAGTIGINVIAVGNLIIEDSHIYAFAQNGIVANLSTSANIVLRNTKIDAIASALSAMVISTTSGRVSASLKNVQISSSTASGLVVKTGGVADVSDSTFSGLGGAGLTVNGGSLSALHNVISNNAQGVLPTAGSIVLLSNDLFNNTTAVSAGVAIGTDNNNKVTTPGSTTITTL